MPLENIRAEHVVALAKRLETVLTDAGANAEPESHTLAHAIADVAQSVERFRSEILPALLDESRSADELKDALLDMGEELRHILYHARDAKFFAYVFEP